MAGFNRAARLRLWVFDGARVFFAALFVVFAGGAFVGAQVRERSPKINAPAAAALSASLTASFADADGNGKAAPGETVTYTATIANNGTNAATNVVYSTATDNNTAYVAGSVAVRNTSLDDSTIKCTYTRSDGLFSCEPSGRYGSTDENLNTIIGGQSDSVQLSTANSSYNAGTGIFQFDATLQNYVQNALGTLDGTTLDAGGIKLLVQKITVNAGSGSVAAIDAQNFRFDQILRQNDVSAAKTFQFSVPNTVDSFTVAFLVSTRAQQMVVINEILTNPGGTITDANGEWFEIYNAGAFAVNMQNFLINDTSATDTGNGFIVSTDYYNRPAHTITANLPIASGGYLVFGRTKNTTDNGGVPVDYAYGGELAFANSRDGLRVRTPAATNALVVDFAYYSSSVSYQDGISRELNNAALDNVKIDNPSWADAIPSAAYGPGGRGTPKAQNSTFTPAPPPPADTDKPARPAQITVAAPAQTVTATVGVIPAGGTAVVTYQVTVANPIPAGTTQITAQGTVSGDNFTTVSTDNPATVAANDATATPVGALAPTASLVAIGGRALTANNRGIRGVMIQMTGASGTTRTATTTAFGYYRFENVAAGETYILTARGKAYTFSQPTRVVNAAEDMREVDFTAYPSDRIK